MFKFQVKFIYEAHLKQHWLKCCTRNMEVHPQNIRKTLKAQEYKKVFKRFLNSNTGCFVDRWRQFVP